MEILAFLVLLTLVGVIAVALVVLGLGGAAIVANHYHQQGEDVPRGVGVLEQPQKAAGATFAPQPIRTISYVRRQSGQ
jgi:hypothetical protein